MDDDNRQEERGGESRHPPLLRCDYHVPLRLLLLDILPQCRLCYVAGYDKADIHHLPPAALPAADSGILGSIRPDGLRLYPPLLSRPLGECLLPDGDPPAACGQGSADDCADLSGDSDEKHGDTAVYLLSILMGEGHHGLHGLTQIGNSKLSKDLETVLILSFYSV